MSEYSRYLFGNNLKYLRNKFNLNQSDLANDLGISQNTISQWEKGVREPDNIEMFLKLAKRLEVTLDELVNSNLEENKITFTNPSDAVEFILRQPMVANFGGYDLDLMSDDEILDMAQDLSEMLQIMAKKHKRK